MTKQSQQIRLEALMNCTKASADTRVTAPLTSSRETSSHHHHHHHHHHHRGGGGGGARQSHGTASISSSSEDEDEDYVDNEVNDDPYPDDNDTYNDFETSLHGLHQDKHHPQQQSGHRSLTDDIVRAFLFDFHEDFNSIAHLKIRECWSTFYSKHYTKEYVLVRSSGNIISQEGLIDMFMDDDLQVEQIKLISVDSIQLLADDTVAVVLYTVEQRFIYKGTKNADQSVYTTVIEQMEETGEPKMVQEHRATGQPILTEETRWSSTSGNSNTATTTKAAAIANNDTGDTATSTSATNRNTNSSSSSSNKHSSATKPVFQSPRSVSSQDGPPRDLTRRRRRKQQSSESW